MTHADPDRDARIAELQCQLAEVRELFAITHELWRRGLQAAQAPGARVVDVECALIGADTGEGEVPSWPKVRTVPGGTT